MLLIWERSPKGRRKRKMACSHSFSLLLLLLVRPGNGERSKRSFFLSRCGGERVAIRLHRPTARRAAFASNAHQGVFFFFFYSSPYSTSSRSFSLPLIPPLLLFSLPRTPPLWNILVLPSCTRMATANLTLLRLHCLVRRCICAYTHAHSYHVGPCRESSWSSFSISLSLSTRSSSSLAPLASTINILVRDSCTATPSADHVTDICKVSIIRGTAPTNRRSRSFFFVGQGFLFLGSVKSFPRAEAGCTAFIKYLGLLPRALSAEYTGD